MSNEQPYGLEEIVERAVVYYSATRPKFYWSIGRQLNPELMSNGAGGHGEPKLAMQAVLEAAHRNNRKGVTSVHIVTQVLHDWVEDGQITVDAKTHTSLWLLECGQLQLPDEDEVRRALVPLLKRRLEYEFVNQAFETYQTGGDLNNVRTKLDETLRVGEDDAYDEADFGLEMLDSIAELAASNRLPTPSEQLNVLLQGGLPRGHLAAIAAASGMGKSTYLTDQIVVAMFGKYRAALISNELELPYQYARLYANLCGVPFADVFENRRPELVKRRLRLLQEVGLVSRDRLKAVRMPQGHTVEHVREWLDEKEQEAGQPFDLVVIDYADRMGTLVAAKDYNVMKEVYGGLRDLAEQRRYWLWTAIQATRGEKDRKLICERHISDSAWKTRLSHLVVSLNPNFNGSEMDAAQVRYYPLKNTTGPAYIPSNPEPHQKMLGRIAFRDDSKLWVAA